MKTYDYLLSYGVKPSVQRIAIMDYLLEHRTHPSIEDIYLALCDDIPTLSKTTVYNTLKLFVEHGAAQMLTIDERNVNYDGDVSLHAHFLCKKCNKIYDLPAAQEEERMDLQCKKFISTIKGFVHRVQLRKNSLFEKNYNNN